MPLGVGKSHDEYAVDAGVTDADDFDVHKSDVCFTVVEVSVHF